jgi:hypothetical protein
VKKSLLIVCILAAAIWAATVPLACGPQKKFCPNEPNGDCPTVLMNPPIDAADGMGGGGGGDSIFLEI